LWIKDKPYSSEINEISYISDFFMDKSSIFYAGSGSGREEFPSNPEDNICRCFI
jgi:hypothetical protein